MIARSKVREQYNLHAVWSSEVLGRRIPALQERRTTLNKQQSKRIYMPMKTVSYWKHCIMKLTRDSHEIFACAKRCLAQPAKNKSFNFPQMMKITRETQEKFLAILTPTCLWP